MLICCTYKIGVVARDALLMYVIKLISLDLAYSMLAKLSRYSTVSGCFSLLVTMPFDDTDDVE